MHTLLSNAIQSIQIGIDDYPDGNRVVSTVRNVHAGILLLFKEKLRQLSPPDTNEILLKSKSVACINPDGTIGFKGDGKKTVGTNEIKSRFKELSIPVDWKKLARLADIRNEIEHYYTGSQETLIREALANAFAVADSFIRHELDKEPGPLIGPDRWQKLLEITNIFEREMRECQSSLLNIRWSEENLIPLIVEFRCLKCDSLLIEVSSGSTLNDAVLQCRACGNRLQLNTDAEAFVKAAMAADCYAAALQGERSPLQECPNCNRESFLAEHRMCALCGHELEYGACLVCGETLYPEDQDLNGLCGYHYHLMSKDD